MFINIIKHLLPRSDTWVITTAKRLREFFIGLAETGDEVKTYTDDVWNDIDPQTTRELTQYETQFNLPGTVLTDQQRRDRLSAAWKALGGQSPSYIQTILQANGFDLYVHDWWNGSQDAREPSSVLNRAYSDAISYRKITFSHLFGTGLIDYSFISNEFVEQLTTPMATNATYDVTHMTETDIVVSNSGYNSLTWYHRGVGGMWEQVGNTYVDAVNIIQAAITSISNTDIAMVSRVGGTNHNIQRYTFDGIDFSTVGATKLRTAAPHEPFITHLRDSIIVVINNVSTYTTLQAYEYNDITDIWDVHININITPNMYTPDPLYKHAIATLNDTTIISYVNQNSVGIHLYTFSGGVWNSVSNSIDIGNQSVGMCFVSENIFAALTHNGTFKAYQYNGVDTIAAFGIESDIGGVFTPPVSLSSYRGSLKGYPLVNKIGQTNPDYVTLCGEALAECGEEDAEAGNYLGFIETYRDYVISDDPDTWPYYMYVGGQTFGDAVIINLDRRNELETLLLKLCPSQLWIGVIVKYE